MQLSALVTAAYVEVQRATGVKPDVKGRINRLLRRPIEADFRALVHFTPPPGLVFIDAGANRGDTISAMRLAHPDVEIVAFEPNPLLADVILAKHRGDRRLTLRAFGLGATSGAFDLYVPYYKGVALDGLASFRREEAANWLDRRRLAGFQPRHQELRTFHCRVAPLDSFALRPAFLKIDVQGLEPALIRGAAETIRAAKPVILMENNDPARDAADLVALGYVPHAYAAGRLHAGLIGDLNTFYIHPDTRHYFAATLYA
jgi:FkbM family methyltransferase